MPMPQKMAKASKSAISDSSKVDPLFCNVMASLAQIVQEIDISKM